MPEYARRYAGPNSFYYMSELFVRDYERHMRDHIEFLRLSRDEYTFDVQETGERQEFRYWDNHMKVFRFWSTPEPVDQWRRDLDESKYNHLAEKYCTTANPFTQWKSPDAWSFRRLSQILEELRGLRTELTKLNQPERENASIVQELQELRLDIQTLRVPERERKDYTLPLGSACLAVLVLMLLFK